MGLFLCFLVSGLTFLVGGFSSFTMTLLIYLLVYLSGYPLKSEQKFKYMSVMYIIAFIYILCSVITSFSFRNGDYFLIYDVMSYTRYIPMTRPNTDFMEYLRECYFELSDSNALHEIYVRGMSIIANNHLDGSNELFLTLAHTIFGVLSMSILYRILMRFYDEKEVSKYIFLFAFLSPFFFYSTVILRDIVIAYFYLLCLEVVLDCRFSFLKIIKLLVFSAIVFGVRLYSGIFCLSFLLYYIYSITKQSKFRAILVPMIIASAAVVGVAVIGSTIYEQSAEELAFYEVLDQGRDTGGLSYKLLGLPPGIKQIVLFLYSQMMPFPPLAAFRDLTIETFSNVLICFLYSIFPIWWFFVSYSLMYWIVFKRKMIQLSQSDWIFLSISVVFIFLNTAHIDVRRMMPVYPIIYLIYLRCKSMLPNMVVRNTHKYLGIAYVSLILAYLVISA